MPQHGARCYIHTQHKVYRISNVDCFGCAVRTAIAEGQLPQAKQDPLCPYGSLRMCLSTKHSANCASDHHSGGKQCNLIVPIEAIITKSCHCHLYEPLGACLLHAEQDC